MISPTELVKRLKFRVYITEELTTLFGDEVKFDENGKRYADVPAHADLKKIVADLHPTWEAGEDFIDMEGLEVSEKKLESTTETSAKKSASDIEAIS